MTERIVLRSEKQKKLSWSFLKRCCLGYAAVFMLLLFFKCPTETAQWVESSLSVCAKRLIPSLFPFMIVSSLLLSSGVGEAVGKMLSKPFGSLFGVGAQGAAALILGWLCGFPIGARSASRLYRDGRISGSEYERIICISGIPSPAFLINVAGASMLGDKTKGIALYFICLSACVLLGILLKIFTRSSESVCDRSCTEKKKRESVALCFTRAVTDSAVSMLYVCGFVVFFSAFVGALDGFLRAAIGECPIADAAFGFFEITVGLTRISSSAMSASAIFVLCAAASAWSGMSVHLQVISLCSDTVFPISKYFLVNFAKTLLALLLSLVCLPLLHIVG